VSSSPADVLVLDQGDSKWKLSRVWTIGNEVEIDSEQETKERSNQDDIDKIRAEELEPCPGSVLVISGSERVN